MRGLPFATIDEPTAHDLDDAVFAESDGAGWHLIVAIADVAWFVRPGTALDHAARTRGNSVYLPDRVIPMLPEALSCGLCSLQPGADRAVLALHLWLDAAGTVQRHRLDRALLRSVARLDYDRVEAAHGQGRGDLDGVPLTALFAAGAALAGARRRRGALDPDLPETMITPDPGSGRLRVRPRPRLGSHRLIEDIMVAANATAAAILAGSPVPALYRVHPAPLAAAPAATAPALPRPRSLLPDLPAARYSPTAGLHFGLALPGYVHFTSPIRRYADLVVHRALIRAGALGPGGTDTAGLGALARHLDRTARAAALAERLARDRLAAAELAGRIGTALPGRIRAVVRTGVQVTLDRTGTDGFAGLRALPPDRYDLAEQGLALIGRRDGACFRVGMAMTATVTAADPATGRVLLAP